MERRKRSRKQSGKGSSSGKHDEPAEEKTGAQRLAEIRDATFANDSPYELELALRKYDSRMYRKDFRAFMRTHQETLVKKFQSYCWLRLPVDCRLQSLDEHQLHALRTSDTIMYRFKLQQALHIYTKSLYRRMFDDWNAAAKTLSAVRRHSQRRFHKKKVQLFRFWRKLASTRTVRKKKNILALVMGNYSLKSRTFYRIKLFNYQTGYIMRTVGTFNKYAKKQKAAFSHLREYVRLRWLRERYHQWWNNCVKEHNQELALDHDWERLLVKPLREWHKWAAFEAHQKRMENLAIQNKMDFDKRMKEADESALILMAMEKEKIDQAEAVRRRQLEVEKEERIVKARESAQKAKKEERYIIISAQRDVRRRRVRKEMTNFKKKFAKKWEKKKLEYIDKAKRRIDAYCADEYNKMAIEMKFEKLKREFFAPPCRENQDREVILTSHKNIVFLYLDAKLRNDDLTMEKVLFKWDKEKRGYLTYDEFKQMIKALGVKLNPSQLSHVIRAVDADGDGCIELPELLDSMKDIEMMGVVGSPWKMYVDAAQDVIVYHNFDTSEKIFEYHMEDEKLMEITRSNIYGAADTEARVQADEAQKLDWEHEINTYMARRLQYMYRFWKTKKTRKRWAWKLKTRESNEKNKYAFYISSWCVRYWIGGKTRVKFKRELKLTFEKMYVADTGKMFWYNHLTKTSHWERPYILWRYGDVKLPADWIPIDVPTVSAEEMQADPSREQMYALHYWHVKGKRDIPRKPDGLPLCGNCQRNLATDFCQDCHLNLCLSCARDTHASPFNFKQKAVLKAEERSNSDLLQKLKNSLSHTLTNVTYPTCKMCNTTKVLAGMHCSTCAGGKGMDMCRPCCRRIHSHETMEHEFYPI